MEGGREGGRGGGAEGGGGGGYHEVEPGVLHYSVVVDACLAAGKVRREGGRAGGKGGREGEREG